MDNEIQMKNNINNSNNILNSNSHSNYIFDNKGKAFM